MPMPIRVKAVGKPSMMATTTSASISRPRWPLVIIAGAGNRINAASTTAAMIEQPEPDFFSHLWLSVWVDNQVIELGNVVVT